MRIIAVALVVAVVGVAEAADLVGSADVIDGDTIDVVNGTGRVRVRLFGIDAPEKGEPGGESATTALLNIVGGRHVTCRDEGGRTHGRVVATCWVSPGRGDVQTDLAAAMVGLGHAAACPRFSPIYIRLEAAARQRRAGIWRRGEAYVRKSYCLERE